MSAAVLAQPLSTPWWRELNARAHRASNEATPTLDEQELTAARHRRDPAAFEMLVRRHQGPIYNFCLRMLGTADDAADVAQDTFVQLYSHLGQLDASEPLAPWLFRVARNRCIDVIRRRRTVSLEDSKDATVWLEPVDDDPLPEELAERADLQHLLSKAIAELPAAYAEVVALRYAADRTFAEIAVIVECDEGAARVRFHRAKALLRRQLRSSLDAAD
jgi:RNA polymerase sigma factor (sigma-70 family)